MLIHHIQLFYQLQSLAKYLKLYFKPPKLLKAWLESDCKYYSGRITARGHFYNPFIAVLTRTVALYQTTLSNIKLNQKANDIFINDRITKIVLLKRQLVISNRLNCNAVVVGEIYVLFKWMKIEATQTLTVIIRNIMVWHWSVLNPEIKLEFSRKNFKLLLKLNNLREFQDIN